MIENGINMTHISSVVRRLVIGLFPGERRYHKYYYNVDVWQLGGFKITMLMSVYFYAFF